MGAQTSESLPAELNIRLSLTITLSPSFLVSCASTHSVRATRMQLLRTHLFRKVHRTVTVIRARARLSLLVRWLRCVSSLAHRRASGDTEMLVVLLITYRSHEHLRGCRRRTGVVEKHSSVRSWRIEQDAEGASAYAETSDKFAEGEFGGEAGVSVRPSHVFLIRFRCGVFFFVVPWGGGALRKTKLTHPTSVGLSPRLACFQLVKSKICRPVQLSEPNNWDAAVCVCIFYACVNASVCACVNQRVSMCVCVSDSVSAVVRAVCMFMLHAACLWCTCLFVVNWSLFVLTCVRVCIQEAFVGVSVCICICAACPCCIMICVGGDGKFEK